MTLSGISMAQAYLKKYLEFEQSFSLQSFYHVSYFNGKWTVDSSLVSDKSSVVILLAASLPDIFNIIHMLDVDRVNNVFNITLPPINTRPDGDDQEL